MMPQAQNVSGGYILIVEPNDITRKLIAGILNSRGYGTYEALDGDGALAFLGKAPSLVILDVDDESPGTVGFLFKMQMSHSHMPLVAMSDQDDKEALKSRLGVKHISFLAKPVMPEVLLGNIESHLIAGVEQGIATEQRLHPALPDEGDSVLKVAREGFMRRAIDLSQEKMDANCGGPFGAVIVRNGRIIAEGWNEVTSANDPTAHAEVMAIRKAALAAGNYSLEGCELYTSCAPCPMCLSAIYWARLDRFFFANTREDAAGIGFDDDFIYREVSLPEHKRTLPGRMMLHEEAKIVFENWLKKSDKTSY